MAEPDHTPRDKQQISMTKTSELGFKYEYGFSMPQKHVYKAKKGLDENLIKTISSIKNEPRWMRRFRLKGYQIFKKKLMPKWGPDLSEIKFDDIYYYIRPIDKQVTSWKQLPEEIRTTYDRIGVPEAEKDFLAGVSAQYDSDVVYESVKKELTRLGVVFCDFDTGLKKYPKIIKKYLGTLISSNDNKFAALNSAVCSGGSFLYVPKNVKVEMPVQAYFRINAKSFGQFERTLIIAEEGSEVHYIEGCTAPIYATDSLHAAVVEIFVKKRAKVKYTTVQNWSKNIYNLVTKRSKVDQEGFMEWVDCNIGSKITMKYPSIYLSGNKSQGEVLSIAFSGKKQHQDSGAKIFHLASNTSSRVISKSISKDGGRTSYRGLVQVMPGVKNALAFVSCNALILDDKSRSDTYPNMRIKADQVSIHHEATTERLEEEKIYYLMSRGITRPEAEGMLVNGFIKPIVQKLPLEYSVELNRLMDLEMEGGVG